MNIEVLSRKELCNLTLGRNEKVAIISITDKHTYFTEIAARNARQMLFVRFNDVEQEDIGCITNNEANIINAFVDSLENVDKIIVSCDGGVSRSPAVAASIMLKLGQNDKSIWENGKYSPNMTVFKTMIKSIFGETEASLIDIKTREQTSIATWKQANDID